MRDRFVILAGKMAQGAVEDPTSLVRQELVPVVQRRDLAAYRSHTVSTVQSDDGEILILGDLFGKDPPYERVTSFDAAGLRALRLRGVAALTELYWGNYVAVIGSADGRTRVVRAPFGQLSAYYIDSADGVAIASDVKLLEHCNATALDVAWRSVVRHILRPNLRTGETCLAGVQELAGGHALTLNADTLEPYAVWSPASFVAKPRQILDAAEASEDVRQVVNGCVAALARSSDAILLGISGGLDSSIVAAGLANCGARFSCLTLYTADPAGDERDYARALASHLGAPLFEELERVDAVDLTRSDATHLPRPLARAFAQSGDASSRATAKRVGASTFFNGGGGDNVFCALQSSAPVADCLLSGMPVQAWRTARDMAAIAETSAVEVFRSGLRRCLARDRRYLWRAEESFLTPEAAAQALAPVAPPWREQPERLLPGRSTHVAWLIGILNHLEGYRRERDHRMVAPLMAQPVVELCLRIPTWLWCTGGRNRSIARQAFADRLPPVVLNRRSKGTPDCFVVEIFEANRPLIRELLCDGLLAAQGILDRSGIEQALKKDGPVRDLTYWRLMTLVDVEAWCRSVIRNGFDSD